MNTDRYSIGNINACDCAGRDAPAEFIVIDALGSGYMAVCDTRDDAQRIVSALNATARTNDDYAYGH